MFVLLTSHFYENFIFRSDHFNSLVGWECLCFRRDTEVLVSGRVGAGRFAKIGIPWPELLAPIVGSVEIVCGVLVLLGLMTRLAVIPLIIVMLTAITTTKIPILLNEGFWKMAHEARTDWAMLLSCLFLLIVGGGAASLDAKILSRSLPKQ